MFHVSFVVYGDDYYECVKILHAFLKSIYCTLIEETIFKKKPVFSDSDKFTSKQSKMPELT